MDNIVRLHETPIYIVFDKDARFTVRLWKEIKEAIGTQLKLSHAFHPLIDGQSQMVIQIVEDLLRSCVSDWEGSWENHLPLVGFACNNSNQSTIGKTTFDALYIRP